jgi:Zn-dependent protease
MQNLSTVQFAAIAILPLLFGITLHEVAHGWVAKRLGDKTALMMGRLTLNPLKHIDPLGTILVPGLMMLAGGAIFGWAKPVPVTWQNLRNPKRDMALVALAGPMANLGMAFIWAMIARLGILLSAVSPWASVPMILMGKVGIVLNLVLMVLNLLPLPPLDGGRIMVSLLPGPLSYRFSRIEPYGFFILIALLMTGVLWKLLGPPVSVLEDLFSLVAGI